MTAPPLLASPESLGVWLGQSIDDGARAEAVLAGASALVRAEAGQNWLNDIGDTVIDVPAEVAAVVVQVAARVWVNPQGLVSSPAGELGSRQWSSATAANGLYLTDSEKAILARYKPGGGSGLWVQPVTRGEQLETEYVDVVGSSEPVPWRNLDVESW